MASSTLNIDTETNDATVPSQGYDINDQCPDEDDPYLCDECELRLNADSQTCPECGTERRLRLHRKLDKRDGSASDENGYSSEENESQARAGQSYEEFKSLCEDSDDWHHWVDKNWPELDNDESDFLDYCWDRADAELDEMLSLLDKEGPQAWYKLGTWEEFQEDKKVEEKEDDEDGESTDEDSDAEQAEEEGEKYVLEEEEEAMGNETLGYGHQEASRWTEDDPLEQVRAEYEEMDAEHEKAMERMKELNDSLVMESKVWLALEMKRREEAGEESKHIGDSGDDYLIALLEEEIGAWERKQFETISKTSNSDAQTRANHVTNPPLDVNALDISQLPQLFEHGKELVGQWLNNEEGDPWSAGKIQAHLQQLQDVNRRVVELQPDWTVYETEWRAWAETVKEQEMTKPVIPLITFERIVREVGQDFKNDLLWEPEAIEALQAASEDYLIGLLRAGNRVAIHAGRTWLGTEDLRLVQELRAL